MPVFSKAELATLSMDPRARAEALIAAGDLDGFATATGEIERSLRGAVAGYHAWIAATIEFVVRETPSDLPAVVAAVREFFVRYPGEARGEEPPAVTAERVTATARGGDHAGALAEYGQMLDAWRALHDLYRDWVSAVLSFVYRERGVDALEQALRFGGEQTLVAWMDTDISRPPAQRLVSAARMMHGHFTRFTLDEDDEKFIVAQDECGSCSRQILAGRYEPPLDLAVVHEPHRVTGGRADIPIYRAHVPVMHLLLPRERIGVPWPLPRCPLGMGTGRCEVHLYKDPYDERANAAAVEAGWIT